MMDEPLMFEMFRSIREYAEEMVRLLLDDTGCIDRYDLFALPKILYQCQSSLVSLENSCSDTSFYKLLLSRSANFVERTRQILANAFPVLSRFDSSGFDMMQKAKGLIDLMLILCLVVYGMHKVEFDVESEELLMKGVQKRFTERQLKLLSLLGIKSTINKSNNGFVTVEGLVAGFCEGGSKSLLEQLTGSTKAEHQCLLTVCNLRLLPRKTKEKKKKKEDAVMGFDNESTGLLEQLTGSTMKIQVISVVGMPGIGKTTLARKLYRDPLIHYHFHIRAWACVSQHYVKRELLLDVLSCLTKLSDKMYRMRDVQLGEQLYRYLKDQRYLVVLDDMWDTQAFDDLRLYFPDDKVGSRIMLTGRDINLNLDPRAASLSHRLRLRTEHESREIFNEASEHHHPLCVSFTVREKVVKQIMRKCDGLPLAIVFSVGLLRNKWTTASWEHVASSLTEYMFRDPNRHMNTVALSYDHLPHQLRPCFLYLSVFPEDCEIPSKKLILLWIAQGYVQGTVGRQTLEDAAEGYLTELLNRSLVMVAKTRSDGGVKACQIHDLMRDLCLRKSKEMSSSSKLHSYGRVSSAFSVSCPSSSDTADQLPGTLATSTQQMHSLLCFPSDLGDSIQHCRSVNWENYYCLRVMDLESIFTSLFPSEVTQLIQLRYLAVQAKEGNPTASISNLVHLQILIISSRTNIVLPSSIWTLNNLRHLLVKTGQNIVEDPYFVQVPGNVGQARLLGSLQTISQVCPSPSCRGILARTPRLRKLGFCGPLVSPTGSLEFPAIHSLDLLQHLRLLNTKTYYEAVKSCNPSFFPEGLRKLTLSNTGLHWDEMWTVGVLPKLEVLKLKFNACIGQVWETSDVGFSQLKFLKLQDLDIVHWRAMSCHFPRLERLVVHHCSGLVEIPSALGEIPTLELIDISWCSASAAESARKIQKEQESNGVDYLKIHTTQ